MVKINLSIDKVKIVIKRELRKMRWICKRGKLGKKI